MWQYNINSNIIDLSRIERSIKSSQYELLELPTSNTTASPEVGDEVTLVYFNKSRLKGVVVSKTEYSHFVLFRETCSIPVDTKATSWSFI